MRERHFDNSVFSAYRQCCSRSLDLKGSLRPAICPNILRVLVGAPYRYIELINHKTHRIDIDNVEHFRSSGRCLKTTNPCLTVIGYRMPSWARNLTLREFLDSF